MSKYFPAGLVLGALLGSTAFLAPVTGFAQGAPAATPPQATTAPAQPGPSTAEDKEKERAAHKALFDAKLAALHAGLELTAAQAPLWTPVETAIRGLWHDHGKEHEAHKDGAGLSPLDRLKHRSEWLSERAKALKTLTDATSPLVASLDAAQKEHLPKLLEVAFKGHKLLYAAFNVPSEEEHEGGHEGWHHEHRDGDEGHRAWHHEHEEGGEDHHWHHHHHHHWGHHHWDHDEGEHEHHWRHEHHGDHDQGDGSAE
jgi:zinc resistance-associated protein